MWKAKYIIGGLNIEPIIFPETISHDEMARALGWIGEIGDEDRCVVGAGFVTIGGDKYAVYGRSVSLNVDSRGEKDEQILNKYLGGLYIES